MNRAILEAKNVETDVPIGCVILRNDEIISSAHNMREQLSDVTAHAEIVAIKKAQQKLKNWRLDDCVMYVTLEPCPMCAWAILQSRMKTVYFGSYNKKCGAFGSVIDLNKISEYKTKIYGGIMEDECDNILNQFFEEIRTK